MPKSKAPATLGERIKMAREANGLTSGELAVRLGVKPQTLQNWEKNQSQPRSNRLMVAAGVLNVTLAWLLQGSGHGPIRRSVEFELADLAQQAANVATEVDDAAKQLHTLRRTIERLQERVRKEVEEAAKKSAEASSPPAAAK